MLTRHSLMASPLGNTRLCVSESNVPSAVEGHNMTFVYIIKNKSGKLYIGISDDPEYRLKEHNSSHGADFTQAGGFELVFKELYPTMVEARRREIQLKKWRRDKKESLIERYHQGLPTKYPL